MLRVTIGTLRDRLGSFGGSFVAIFLAVALGTVCGILIDSTDQAVPAVNRFEATSAVVQVDRHVDPGEVAAPESEYLVTLSRPPRISGDVTAKIAEVDGVRDLVGDVSFYAQIVNPDGRALTGPGNSASVGHSWSSAMLTPFELRAGDEPSHVDEVVIDSRLARLGNVDQGDTVEVLTATEQPHSYTVSGIVSPESTDTLANQASIFFHDDAVRNLSGPEVGFDLIGVFAEEGIEPDEIAGRLEAVLGNEFRVFSKDEASRAEVSEAAVSFDEVAVFVGTMAGFSGFIAIFILANTFNISVLQRTRQIGLLRAVGATPGQIRWAIVIEALIVALLAGVLGALLGRAIATAFAELLVRYGIAPAEFEPVVRSLPMVIAVALGLFIALISVVSASLRASRIEPLQALFEANVEPLRLPWWRIGLGLLTGLGAFALLREATTLSADDPAGAAFLFGVTSLMTVAFVGPILVRPVVFVAGAIVARLGGSDGELANANCNATPRRVSSSSIPVILIVTFSCLILGMFHIAQEATAEESRKRTIADFVLLPDGARGLPQPLVDDVNDIDGVEVAGGVHDIEVMIINMDDVGRGRRHPGMARGVDVEMMGNALEVGVVDGSAERLSGKSIAISQSRARADGMEIGDTVDVLFPDTTTGQLEVVATFSRSLGIGEYLLPIDLTLDRSSNQLLEQVNVSVSNDANITQVQENLETLSERYPTMALTTPENLHALIEDDEGAVSIVMYIFLGLAGVYASLSIVNTMVMATAERSREFATLGLIGNTPGQTLRMVIWESLIVLITGLAVALTIAGTALAAISHSLSGTPVFPMPVVDFGLIIAVATVLVVGASVIPAVALMRNVSTSTVANRE